MRRSPCRPTAASRAAARRAHRGARPKWEAFRSYYCTVRLILASASPRRAELLRAAGYSFDVVVADVDESIRRGETPATYVRRLAAEKSNAALKRCLAALKGCATDFAAVT